MTMTKSRYKILSFEISSKRVHILVLELWHTTMAIEQMLKQNKHIYQPQMKYFTISVELYKQMRVCVLSIC